MSKYTTGEMAKLCGVSVRTVQYYDTRGILVPSELSEGGRRLYSEDDVRKMKIICFLRDVGLSISSIGELLAEEDPGSVIDVLLEEQEKTLREEISERQRQLAMLEQIRRERKNVNCFSVESIGDIAHIMSNKEKLTRMRLVMILIGVIMEIIEVGSIICWVRTGNWWPFAISLCIILVLSVVISVYYYKCVAYICPQCHVVFKPTFKQMFWAYHTPKTRRLTCPECGHRGLCVETWDE